MNDQEFISFMQTNFDEYIAEGASVMEFATDMAHELHGKLDAEALDLLNGVESVRELRVVVTGIAHNLVTA